MAVHKKEIRGEDPTDSARWFTCNFYKKDNARKIKKKYFFKSKNFVVF